MDKDVCPLPPDPPRGRKPPRPGRRPRHLPDVRARRAFLSDDDLGRREEGMDPTQLARAALRAPRCSDPDARRRGATGGLGSMPAAGVVGSWSFEVVG